MDDEWGVTVNHSYCQDADEASGINGFGFSFADGYHG